MNKLILVDDDQHLFNFIKEQLEDEGFYIDYTHNVDAGLHRISGDTYTIAVLNIMLPGKWHGLKSLQHLRTKTKMPVIVLSPRGNDIDRIVGLEMGADDYLVKPFNPRELLARIRAILRRTHQGLRLPEDVFKARNIYSEDDVEFHRGMRKVAHQGKFVNLTSAEFDMLEILIRYDGNIVTREEIAKEVFKRDLAYTDRSIDVHICNLRKKFDHAEAGAGHIKSVRGKGYAFVSSPPRATELARAI